MTFGPGSDLSQSVSNPTEQSITCVLYVVYLVASRIGNFIDHTLKLTS